MKAECKPCGISVVADDTQLGFYSGATIRCGKCGAVIIEAHKFTSGYCQIMDTGTAVMPIPKFTVAPFTTTLPVFYPAPQSPREPSQYNIIFSTTPPKTDK